MAIFPTLSPGSRTFTPGDYYHSAFSSYNGQQSRVSHSTGMTTSRLELVYPVMSAADMQQILNHYIGQLGRYASFQVPAEVLAGFTASDFRLSGYGWRYADSPQVEEFASDLGIIYYTVRVTLESVADSGAVASGFNGAIRLGLSSGTATASSQAPGASQTITVGISGGSASSGPTDPYFSSVSLLLHMDGSNGSTTFTDSSLNALAVTANGDAKISTAQSKFGGASGAFDGTEDFLSSANNSLFDFGSGDLTLEAWVYLAGNSTPDNDGFRSACICSTWSTALPLSGWALNIQGNTTTTGTGINFDTWSSGNGTLFRATTTVSQNSWNHIAVTVSGGTRRIFLNGALLTGTTTSSGSGYTQANSLGNPIRVGSTQLVGYPVALNGYIDDLRITKGVARYTANFTPPTAPFPDS